jgi:hypothetical protein
LQQSREEGIPEPCSVCSSFRIVPVRPTKLFQTVVYEDAQNTTQNRAVRAAEEQEQELELGEEEWQREREGRQQNVCGTWEIENWGGLSDGGRMGFRQPSTGISDDAHNTDPTGETRERVDQFPHH